MNKNIIIVFLLVLILLGGTLGYRSYRAEFDRAIAAEELAAARGLAENRAEDEWRRVEAQAEAHRLAALQAQQEADAVAASLAKLRAEQAEAEAARIVADREAAAATERLAQLRHEKELAQGEARRSAAEAEQAALAVEIARREAAEKMAAAEKMKREAAEAEQRRLVQLRAVQENELEEETVLRRMLSHMARTPDTKRRMHDFRRVENVNADGGIVVAPEMATGKTPPAD